MELPQPEFHYVTLPLPYHNGIILSHLVTKMYSLDRIREILISANLESGFEKINRVNIKLVDSSTKETLWIVKWKDKENNDIFGLICGSEL